MQVRIGLGNFLTGLSPLGIGLASIHTRDVVESEISDGEVDDLGVIVMAF